MMKSSKLLLPDTVTVEPQEMKHAASASKCQSTLQPLYARLAGPVSRKRSMEDQEVADDVSTSSVCQMDPEG